MLEEVDIESIKVDIGSAKVMPSLPTAQLQE